MKLFEIFKGDASDFRSGDEADTRSPYYDGPDDDNEGDPLPAFLKTQEAIVDAEHKSNDVAAFWTIECGTSQQASDVVQFLKSSGVKNLKVKADRDTNHPDADYVTVQAQYQF